MTICDKKELFLFLYTTSYFRNLMRFGANNSFFFALKHKNSFCSWTEICIFSIESAHRRKCDGQAFQSGAPLLLCFLFWYNDLGIHFLISEFFTEHSAICLTIRVFYDVLSVFYHAVSIFLCFSSELLFLLGRTWMKRVPVCGTMVCTLSIAFQ